MFWRSLLHRIKVPRVVECSLYLCGRCGTVHGTTMAWTRREAGLAVCPVCAKPGTTLYKLAYDAGRCVFVLL